MADDWKFFGKSSRAKIPLISSLSMEQLLQTGAEGFLVYALDVLKASPVLADIPVVCEFADIFLDEIPGLPPMREIDFSIELVPGTLPISKAPYRMAPLEMKELKDQLEYLLNKGYIRPSVSPWGASVLFVRKKTGFFRLAAIFFALKIWRHYLYGKSNAAADALSRKICDLSLSTMRVSKLIEDCCVSGLDFETDIQPIRVYAITAEPELFVRIKEAQKVDQNIQNSIERVRTGHESEFQVSMDGILFVNRRIVVPDIAELRQQILNEAHCSKFSIHPGGRKMYNDLKQKFWWKRMKADVANYQSSIQMAPFEALYGRKCRSPLFWNDLLETPVTRPDMIREMSDKVKLIQIRMKTAQDRQAKYENVRRRPLMFEQGDWVFLKISPFRGTVRFGKRGKLSPRFIGPYEIIDKVGDLAYRLALPPALSGIHDVFHVSMLRKYEPDASHILRLDEAELDETLSYFEHPIQILDHKERQLRNKSIPLVKVQWSRHGIEEATWETEQDMRQRYPELFH
ncbi:uncharacterized protein [Henckelia pumila]|uniref:uncharacterized protein n=1 Tax=Henckelia pumila TaxID=405737 RepID=UPI003C6DECF0